MARSRRLVPPTKTLTDQQKYLLQRLPGKYEIAEPQSVEPNIIRQMRKKVELWDAQQRKLSCRAKCDGEKLITLAREAIYFKPIEVALRIVQQAEALKKCCEGD